MTYKSRIPIQKSPFFEKVNKFVGWLLRRCADEVLSMYSCALHYIPKWGSQQVQHYDTRGATDTTL